MFFSAKINCFQNLSYIITITIINIITKPVNSQRLKNELTQLERWLLASIVFCKPVQDILYLVANHWLGTYYWTTPSPLPPQKKTKKQERINK